MKYLIKRMRELADMSQEQFSKEIGTTVVSINRWENGKSSPNPIDRLKETYARKRK